MVPKIIKPPRHLVWLDTWAVSEVTAALTKGSSSNPKLDKAWAENLLEQIRTMRQAGKIVVPIGHQLGEIATGGLPAKDVHHTMAQMSNGLRLQYHRTVKDLQTYRTMQAMAAGQSAPEYSWEDVFESPEEVINPPSLNISLYMEIPGLVELQRATVTATYNGWLEVRKNYHAHKLNAKTAVANELNGPYQAALVSMNPEANPQVLPSYLVNVAQPLEVLRRTGAGKTIEDLLTFYQSEAYKETPAIRIKAELFAQVLTSQAPLLPSDCTDIDEISSVLPFSSIMVTDGAMRDKVQYKLKLTSKYDVKVVKLSELPDALDSLPYTTKKPP